MISKQIYIVCLLVIILGFGKVLADVVPQAPTSPAIESNNEFNRIAQCESNGNLHAKNSNSSASGEFQWINSSWYHYGRELWGEDFYQKNIWSNDNRELAWYVYNKYGTSDWNESKYCWGQN